MSVRSADPAKTQSAITETWQRFCPDDVLKIETARAHLARLYEADMRLGKLEGCRSHRRKHSGCNVLTVRRDEHFSVVPHVSSLLDCPSNGPVPGVCACIYRGSERCSALWTQRGHVRYNGEDL